jgi:23S rRNA (adenine-N6)-dimethyltransferase
VSAGPRRAELSQHFLRKGTTAARLVRATTISRSDLVVEIGAGRGALTLPLSQRAGRVIAVEVDSTLAAKLAGQFDNRVEIVNDDFLAMPLPSAVYKAFGNVPFSLTTDIVRRLVRAPSPPCDAWLVVQREAAHRFCGPPYVGESLWSLRLKPWWHVEIVDRLRRVDFDPPPSVESVLMWLARRDRPLLDGAQARLYLDLIECAYGTGANHSLAKLTAAWLSKTEIRRLAQDLRFAHDGRPSVLGFEQWLGIVRFINCTGRGL